MARKPAPKKTTKQKQRKAYIAAARRCRVMQIIKLPAGDELELHESSPGITERVRLAMDVVRCVRCSSSSTGSLRETIALDDLLEAAALELTRFFTNGAAPAAFVPNRK